MKIEKGACISLVDKEQKLQTTIANSHEKYNMQAIYMQAFEKVTFD